MLNEKRKYGKFRKTKLNMSFRNYRWGGGGKQGYGRIKGT